MEDQSNLSSTYLLHETVDYCSFWIYTNLTFLEPHVFVVYNIQILLIPKYDLYLDGTYISSEDDYFEKLHFLGTVNLYWSFSIWHEDVEMIAQLFFTFRYI